MTIQPLIQLVKHAHSARVRLRLHVNGDDLEVAQIADGLCILRDPRPHPPGNARLVVSVDDHTETHDVFLCHGISATSRKVIFF